VSAVFEAPAYAADGTIRPRQVQLPADPFDGRVHEAAMHQAVRVYLANQRQGTAATKTRGLVSGGNQKPWRQKGTGRARQGSIRAPHWPGGGTAFGPQPREYRLALPNKVRWLARRSALNARARARALRVIAPLGFEAPKTRRFAELLARMGLAGERVLFLTAEPKPNVLRSARNIPGVAVLPWAQATTYDILRARTIVVEESALGALEEGGAVEAPVAAPQRPRRRAKPEPEPELAAAAAAPAPRKKPAARKAAAKAAAKTPARKTARPAAKKAAKPKAKPKSGKPAPKKPGRKKD
jgi:large subunit ribosomal protein L4